MSKYDYTDPIFWRDAYNNASSAYKAGSALGSKLKPYWDSAMSLPGEISKFTSKYGLISDVRRVNNMSDNSSSKRPWNDSMHYYKDKFASHPSRDMIKPKRTRGNDVGVTESTEPPGSTTTNMSTKYKRFRTFGHYGGHFTGKFKKKALSAAYTGAVLKWERNSTLSDATALYVGHNSSPIYQTVRAIGWSIVRLIAKKWHQDFTSFDTTVNGPEATSSCDVRITITYRTSVGGICIDTTSTTAASTFGALGDSIMSRIIAVIVASDVYFELVRIKIANAANTAEESLQTVVLYGHNLNIKVTGYSKLRVQNNTVSTSGDAATNEQSTDIANNPLVGKQYHGFGQTHMWKYNNDYAVSTPQFGYSVNHGHLTMVPTTVASITTGMQNILYQVPNHKAFTGLKGYKNVKLAPGEIKASVVKWSKQCNMNQWIKYLMPVFRASADIDSLSSGASLTPMGNVCIIGLQHMLHAGTEPDVSISYQIDGTVTAVATHKKKMFCSASFNEGTGTLLSWT